MTVLKIVLHPDPILKQKSKPIEEFDTQLEQFVSDMKDTMRDFGGIGLAAVQVGQLKRVLIIDIGDLTAEDPYLEEEEKPGEKRKLAKEKTIEHLEIFINPEIVESSGEIEYNEGCLSIPGITGDVTRKRFLTLKYQDLNGHEHKVETEGLRSIVLQHEIDHLDGVLFIDHLGPMKKVVALKKYEKFLQSLKEEA